MSQNPTNQSNNNQKAFYTDSRSSYVRVVMPVLYTVWALLGVLLIVLLSIGMFGGGTWQENLNLSDATTTDQSEEVAPESQQPPAQQPQAQEPTEEQLACVAEQLGEERLLELQQGAEADDPEEIAVIESCLLENDGAPEQAPEGAPEQQEPSE